MRKSRNNATIGADLLRAGDITEALKFLKLAVKENINDLGTLTNIATCYNRAGLVTTAEKLYRYILSKDGNNGVCLLNLGNCLINQARHIEARECFYKCLEINPGHIHAADNICMSSLYDLESKEVNFIRHKVYEIVLNIKISDEEMIKIYPLCKKIGSMWSESPSMSSNIPIKTREALLYLHGTYKKTNSEIAV